MEIRSYLKQAILQQGKFTRIIWILSLYPPSIWMETMEPMQPGNRMIKEAHQILSSSKIQIMISMEALQLIQSWTISWAKIWHKAWLILLYQWMKWKWTWKTMNRWFIRHWMNRTTSLRIKQILSCILPPSSNNKSSLRKIILMLMLSRRSHIKIASSPVVEMIKFMIEMVDTDIRTFHRSKGLWSIFNKRWISRCRILSKSLERLKELIEFPCILAALVLGTIPPYQV